MIAVRHETVGSPESQHRLRIAHLSDLHLWFSNRKLETVEQVIEEWRPDVLALTGDYADTWLGRRLALEWIEKMVAAYPLCWIAGNHDRCCGRSFLQKLERVLLACPIDRHDAWITGKSGFRYRFTSWERLKSSAPDPKPTVVLLHDPALIQRPKLRGGSKCLLLAGHLHGGQITLWRDRQGRSQPAATCYPWLIDRTTIEEVPLIVSRGLGDTLPLRFRTPKEIVMVDFYA